MSIGEPRVDPPTEYEYDFDDDDGGEEYCTHCNGEGYCTTGADPLGDCPDEPHRCHACHGSGERKDQTVF